MLITQQLASIANKNLIRPAIRYLGKEMNYGELRTAIARLSYLYQNEIGQNGRVAFITRNSPATIITFFALTNTRSVIIPIDPDRSPEEIIAWLKDSKATHVAVTNDLINQTREILLSARMSLPIVEIEKKHGGEYDTSFTASTEHQPLETDTVLLLRTAGLTGKPHLAAFTHKQLNHATTCLRSLYHVNLSDRFMTKLNWAHPFAFLHGMLFPLMSGATCVIDHGLDTTALLQFFIESRVNRLLGNPLFFHKLLVTCRNENRLLTGIKSITVAGGLLPREEARIYERMRCAVTHCYGQTENLWTISMQDTAREEPTHQKGKEQVVTLDDDYGAQKPLPGMKYKVLDANGDLIEGNDLRTGYLAVMGPTVMSGYQSSEKGIEKETKSKIRGTWLYTGDVARLEGDGEELKITIIGRKDDLLQAGNEYISMDEVTDALKRVHGVEDAAAFVVKRVKGDFVIAGAVVKATGGSLNEKQIIESCAKNLYPEQVPKVIVFTDFIPRDFGGNPHYGRLSAQFEGVAG
ncbi:MAG: hypothetical protein A2428_13200 [Bdellovibrionales bacterium RIFOXYC1_FULL_54_43]|nr:MAG: hypothetical protein A2428_13200 [Bdellovibrionales bacterium RIFOXYC1_FULL_54_43]OFZ83680.1 MAG: hypothetical protein A2603_16650 [Bdellovibrionales bacterium RIFOXYD1_FULL_55_31]